MPTRDRRRKLNGWGYEDDGFQPPEPMLALLRDQLGELSSSAACAPGDLQLPAPRDLPTLPSATSRESLDRALHARGRSFSDLLRLRSNTLATAPDAVLRPANADQVEAVLQVASKDGIRVIPFGGGSSVTGGLTVLPDSPPTISLDLEHLCGLSSLDPTSGLATFGAGTLGPDLEEALKSHGLSLGHFPQSFEMSTLGGWAVTRSSGQESMGNGRIEKMIAGLEMVTPSGRVSLPPLPGSAAGPDLKQLIMGSEGRFGIVTELTVRVHDRPEHRRVEAFLLPSWPAGLETCREIARSGVPLAMLRLSDPDETRVAMTVGLEKQRFKGLIETWLQVRGFGEGRCLMLLGATGSARDAASAMAEARRHIRASGGTGLGRGPGEHWKHDRFRHPYLRDGLFDHGIATDTLETAAPWSALPGLYRDVRGALTSGLAEEGEKVVVGCHVSHPYDDGASLYFTFFFRSAADVEATMQRWMKLKRAASQAIVANRATISHHHGVGTWHAPWLRAETSDHGAAALTRVAEHFDPAQIMNPAVLLDPTDRLSV